MHISDGNFWGRHICHSPHMLANTVPMLKILTIFHLLYHISCGDELFTVYYLPLKMKFFLCLLQSIEVVSTYTLYDERQRQFKRSHLGVQDWFAWPALSFTTCMRCTSSPCLLFTQRLHVLMVLFICLYINVWKSLFFRGMFSWLSVFHLSALCNYRIAYGLQINFHYLSF